MAVRKVKLAELVEDWDIYPRHNYDSGYVRQLADVLAAGETLPPPVVARKGMRIVDGWHRVRAYRRHLGAGGEIDADVRSYSTEADVVRDAVKLNAKHGRKLDEQDKARSALLLERHGIVIEEIKVILSMPVEKIRTITASPGRIVVVPVGGNRPPSGGGSDTDGREKVPAKPSGRAPNASAPRVLTRDQAEAHASSNGWSVGQNARALIRQIETGLTAPEFDPAGVTALWDLHDVIEKHLARPAAA